MQAIILAAGMGKRLGELTRENTKCMVKVHEQTLIERMIGQLERLALKRIIIVIGYKGEKVRDLLGNKIHNTPIIYISNPIYDKTNNIYSLYLAKEFLVEDETILLESDLILTTRLPTWRLSPNMRAGWTAPSSRSTRKTAFPISSPRRHSSSTVRIPITRRLISTSSARTSRATNMSRSLWLTARPWAITNTMSRY